MARCTGRHDHTHELLPRSAGGSITDPENCIGVCVICHDWIHKHRPEAERLGLLKSRYDMDINPIDQAAQDIRDARRRTFSGEYDAAVKLAAANGMKLLGVERMERYDIDVAPNVAVTLMAATGVLDANDLTPAECDALVERIGPPPVRSLLGLIEALIAVRKLSFTTPPVPNHIMPAKAAG